MSRSKYSLPTNECKLKVIFSFLFTLLSVNVITERLRRYNKARGWWWKSSTFQRCGWSKLFVLKLWLLTAAFIVQYTLNVRSRGKQLCFSSVLIEMHMPLALNRLIYTVPLYCGYVGLATNLLLFLLCASILQKHHFLTPWDQSQIPCCWSSSTFYSNDRQNFPKATTKTHKQRLIVSFPSSLSWVLDEHDNR